MMGLYSGAGPMDVLLRIVLPGIAAVVMLGYVGYAGTSYLEQPQLRPDLVTLRSPVSSGAKAGVMAPIKAEQAPCYDGSSLGPEISI